MWGVAAATRFGQVALDFGVGTAVADCAELSQPPRSFLEDQEVLVELDRPIRLCDRHTAPPHLGDPSGQLVGVADRRGQTDQLDLGW